MKDRKIFLRTDTDLEVSKHEIVRFSFDGDYDHDYVDVSFRQEGGMIVVELMADGHLIINPRSTNCAHVIVRRFGRFGLPVEEEK